MASKTAENLPAAIALLATSIFALAAVLARKERDTRYSSTSGQDGQSTLVGNGLSESTSMAVTDDDEPAVIADRRVSSTTACTSSRTRAALGNIDTPQDLAVRQDELVGDTTATAGTFDQVAHSPPGRSRLQSISPTSGDVRRDLRRNILLREPRACNPTRHGVIGVNSTSYSPITNLQADPGRQIHETANADNRRNLILERPVEALGSGIHPCENCCTENSRNKSKASVGNVQTAFQSTPSSSPLLLPPTSAPRSPALAVDSPVTFGEKQGTCRLPGQPRRSLVTDARVGASNLGGGVVTSSGPIQATNKNGRRLEMLVHNVSHKDMVLSLCRAKQPAASSFPAEREENDVSTLVLDAVSTGLYHVVAYLDRTFVLL